NLITSSPRHLITPSPPSFPTPLFRFPPNPLCRRIHIPHPQRHLACAGGHSDCDGQRLICRVEVQRNGVPTTVHLGR
ncbi:unnamed protein product, partial [Closterium sp. NIES-64]